MTRASGARDSSIRFVAGELDPMATREAFLTLPPMSSPRNMPIFYRFRRVGALE